jgi:aminoglycoside phosphotransferase (APT) family kinase protein
MLSPIIASDALEHILTERLGCSVRDVKPFGVQTAHCMYTALWDQPEQTVPILIRCFENPRAEDDASMEAAAQRDLYQAGYPVPELHLLVESDKVIGKPFIVMQFLEGQPLSTLIENQPETMPAWIDRFASLMLKLHSLRWQALSEFFSSVLAPLDFAERQVRWWEGRAKVYQADYTAEGFQWLRANLYRTRSTTRTSLVHRDFQLNNVLVSDDKMSGVVDWGELTLADPAVDAGWTRMILSTEIGAECGDMFADAYCRRNPDAAETAGFWEVFASCKRLTLLAGLAQTNAPDLAQQYTSKIQTILDFMRQRLVDED